LCGDRSCGWCRHRIIPQLAGTLAAITTWKSRHREVSGSCRRHAGHASYSIRVSPRIDDYTAIADTKQSLPLIGLDLVTEASAYAQNESQITSGARGSVLQKICSSISAMRTASGWARALGTKPATASNCSSTIESALHGAGVYPDSTQRIRYRDGHCDCATGALAVRPRRSYPLKVPASPSLEDWQQRLRAVAPRRSGSPSAGTGTTGNRRMLAAFRWNLRLLSYISLVVGAFLIYNTISVSVVRRRAEIGIVRASRRQPRRHSYRVRRRSACFGMWARHRVAPRPLHGTGASG